MLCNRSIEFYQKEAALVLPSDEVAKGTEEIDTMFRVCEAVHISANKFIGTNVARFCKDMIRRKQPASLFYVALCFITELSLAMLLYALCFCGIRLVVEPSQGMMTAFLCHYGLFPFAGFILYHYVKKSKFRKILKQSKGNMNTQL